MYVCMYVRKASVPPTEQDGAVIILFKLQRLRCHFVSRER